MSDNEFAIGDTVQVQEGDVMRGTVGTVVHHDPAHGYLVRVSSIQQNWVQPEHLKKFG